MTKPKIIRVRSEKTPFSGLGKKRPVSSDALDRIEFSLDEEVVDEKGQVVGTVVDFMPDPQNAGSRGLHHWPREAGKGWERTMRSGSGLTKETTGDRPDDRLEALRRLRASGDPVTMFTCRKCKGQCRIVFHDETGIHLVEFRCFMCGGSYWPNGGGTMP